MTCKAKTMTDSGMQRCQRKSGHRGWHWYTIWDYRAIVRVMWKKFGSGKGSYTR